MALTGPAIWAAHFFGLYLTEAFLCPAPQAASQVHLITLVLTATGVAALGALMLWQVLWKERSPDGNGRFLRDVSMALAATSMLAVLWGSLPAMLLPACTPASA